MQASYDDSSLDKPRPNLLRHGSHFDVPRWHLEHAPSVTRDCARTSLPGWLGQYFHPTHATLARDDGVEKAWASRKHRKHRYAAHVPNTRRTRRYGAFHLRLASMLRVEYWNISWWVAQIFTWGSVIWVVNGFASFLPFCNSHVQFDLDLAGWTAFIGATVFEVGSVIGLLEAWNRHDAVAFSNNSSKESLDPENSDNGTKRSEDVHLEAMNTLPKADQTSTKKKWIWFSTDSKYFHELGFLAAFFQLLGATIFWISGFTAIPTIQRALEKNQGLNDGIFWTPQVVGGSGFIISAIFIMLEDSKTWWKPRPLSLGWQIGAWNFIGAIGFTLCGALGYSTSSGALYQSSLATFWGSWAFLIASVLQWYECVNGV
ncbi:hypothetical protein GALMADRAFT_104940 [Galerina marginata CBS 339.88]|uniref:Integral membrane protein n=1 Tax=Galerina marginata (strain CBS 339.88) TaxID=685588 RepID=A0A067SNN9_GALM3|nr:hypothetical protein GALMADRAFT_104940 [Galerina marginata CBS 339.88]